MSTSVASAPPEGVEPHAASFDGFRDPFFASGFDSPRFAAGGEAGPAEGKAGRRGRHESTADRERPQGAAGEAGLGNTRTASGDALGDAVNRRRLRDLRILRFKRQKRSSGLLVSRARDDAALEYWTAMTNLGAPVDDHLVTVLPSGEIHGKGDALGKKVFIRPPRPARCGWALASQVGVHSDEVGKAHFGTNEEGERAVERCASISACPSCAAVIRGRRALDIGRAVEAWQGQGGQAMFLTLTLRHKRTHTLEETLDVLMDSWKLLQSRQLWAGSGKRSKRHVPGLREQLDMRGWIRSLEVTFTDRSGPKGTGNGWHPHLHMLLFVRDLPMPVEKLRDTLAAEWKSVVQRRSPEHTPSSKRGVDLQTVTGDGTVLAGYLAKVQGEASIGAEMARHDWKSGAHRGSWSPFELLDEGAPDDLDSRNAALWIEYATTMHGRRVIEWSRGLRAELLPEDPELTDEEVIADVEAEEWQLDLPRKIYRQLRNDPVLVAWYLDAAAYGDWEAATAYLHGAAPPGPVFST